MPGRGCGRRQITVTCQRARCGANPARAGGICLRHAPIARGLGEYACDKSRTCELRRGRVDRWVSILGHARVGSKGGG
eukprot:467607-Prorocentrum_minimum.AAC.2